MCAGTTLLVKTRHPGIQVGSCAIISGLPSAASEADVVKAVEIIYPIVKEFRCDLRTRTNGVRRAHKRVPANLDIKRPRMSMQVSLPISFHTYSLTLIDRTFAFSRP